ncbi:MAG TPA: hypothetical protein VJ725_18910 [Thermoanaerobaculia bacterium]|nr:hypothetical protein [Thermoanaerobaculia bacterium]
MTELKALRRLLPAFLLAGMMATGQPATAGVHEWTSHGPEGGSIGSLVIDPTDPEALYALSTTVWDAAFRSLDGGATWQRMDVGPGHIVMALVVHPENPSLLYAATFQAGVFKSSDRGKTWTGVGGLTDQLVSLAIDPVTPSTLYTGTLDGMIFKSTDSGESWQATGAAFGDTEVSPIVIDPQTPSTLYAATLSQGLFKSTNGGTTWVALSNSPRSIGSVTQTLVLDPKAPGTLYAADFFAGIYKSVNGGASWVRLRNDIPLSLALDPSAPSTVYAATYFEGVLKSQDGGSTWRSLGLTDERVFSVAVDPTASSTLYAGTGSGVYKTRDSRSWTTANRGLSGTSVSALAIDPTTPSVAYAGTYTGIAYKTVDGGRSWSALQVGEKGRGMWALAIDPKNPNTVYASTDTGVFKSTDGGRRWSLSSSGLPEPPFGLTIDPVTPSIVYAAMASSGVYKSFDGGRSWVPSHTGLGQVRVWSLALDPRSPSTLYAATAGSGVYKTTNAGESWFPANAGLSSSPQGIEAIAIDPANPSTLFACDAQFGLARSKNAGGQWTVLSVNGAPFYCSSLAAAGPATVYADDRGTGVFFTQNAGATWLPLNQGLNGSRVTTLAADSAGAAVYAGTIGRGVFEYSTSSPSPCVASDTTVCLHGGRFALRATFETPGSPVGTAREVQLTDDSAYLWFFSPANVEAFLKVVDGCALNGRFWVFAAGLTDVRTSLLVTDSQTGIVRSFINPQGTPFQPIQETSAFPCSTAQAAAESFEPAKTLPALVSKAVGPCTANATTLCLGNRFAVTTTFQTADGQTGSGMATALTDDTGYFWFFDAVNPEVLVKVLDACVPFDRVWVFAAGLTDVHVTTTVTDTVTGRKRTYVNSQGTPFTPVQDTNFRACVP